MPIDTFLLSQIFAGIAFFLDAFTFQFKERRAVLLCMLCGGVLGVGHFFLLGAHTASWISILFCIRIATAYYCPRQYLAFIFMALAAVVTAFSWGGWISLVAFFGNCAGTLATFQKNDLRMRLIFLLASGLWLVHNAVVWTPVGIAQELCFSCGNLIGLWKFYRAKR